jgi:secondary thiamine-phosphate synthase enzyme
MTATTTIEFETGGNGEMVDLTDRVVDAVAQAGIRDGLVTVCAIGSTASVTTIEYEPGLIQDMPALLQTLIPAGVPYQHDATWGDGNGYAHLRSALIGTTFTTAVVEGQPVLGTWQQIVFLEFDNRARQRRVCVQVIGD